MMKGWMKGILALMLAMAIVGGSASLSFAVFGDGAGDGGQFVKRGKPIAGVKVTITQTNPDGTKTQTETETDDRGFFFLPSTGSNVTQIRFTEKDGTTSTFSGPFFDLAAVRPINRLGTGIDSRAELLEFDFFDSNEEGGIPNIANLSYGLGGPADEASSQGWDSSDDGKWKLGARLFGGLSVAQKQPSGTSRQTNGGMGSGTNDFEKLFGPKIGFTLMAEIPANGFVSVPGFYVFAGYEEYFDREERGGQATLHSILDAYDTFGILALEHMGYLGLGFYHRWEAMNIGVGGEVGGAAIAVRLDGFTDEGAGGGDPPRTFGSSSDVTYSPYLNFYVRRQIWRISNLPVSLETGLGGTYIPSRMVTGRTNTFSLDYAFESEGFWDIDWWFGLYMPIPIL